MGAPEAKRFGPYEIVGRLGFGGMGIVLDARGADGKPVALKLLRPTGDAYKHKVFAARFNREAKILKKLSHPGVVRLLDSGTIHGIFFLAMERIEGKSLGVLSKKQRLDAETIIALGIKIGETLAHLHEIGIVHRDIKPDNVIIDADGRPILTDFGLARLSGGTAITRANELVGSLGYIAPEVIEGSVPSPSSDQYALGRLMFNLSVKKKDEASSNVPLLEALKKSMKLDWDSFPNQGGFVRLAELIKKMVARDPKERFPDMYSLIVELDALARALAEVEQGTSIDAATTDRNQIPKALPRAPTQSAPPPDAIVPAVARNWEDDTRWDPDAEKKLLDLALAAGLSAPAALPPSANAELDWVQPISDRDFLSLSGAIASDDEGQNVGDTQDMMIKLRNRRALPYSVIERSVEEQADKSDKIAQLRKQTQAFWSEKLKVADTNPPEPPAEPPPDVLEHWQDIVGDLSMPPEGATMRMAAVPVEPPDAVVIEPAIEATDPAPEPESFRPLIPYPQASRPVPIAPSLLMEEHINTQPPERIPSMSTLPNVPAAPAAQFAMGPPKVKKKPAVALGVAIAAIAGALLTAGLWFTALSPRNAAPRYEGKEPPNASQRQLAVELHAEAERALQKGDLEKARRLLGLCITTADLSECKTALESMR